LRRELADSHVKVLYIAPRATRTAMNSADVVAMNDALKVEMDDPQEVARQIVHAIATERKELYLGWPEKLFVRLNGLLPRLVDQALRKQLPVIKRFARADQSRPPSSQPTSTGEHP
ncbi:MAG: short chain dehydrogenase, partial [Gammaproteobacteria bacterium]|nr:short chain dehydrogenase [Gammaproteobacteria bacterium]